MTSDEEYRRRPPPWTMQTKHADEAAATAKELKNTLSASRAGQSV
jgi:hypothetical protein